MSEVHESHHIDNEEARMSAARAKAEAARLAVERRRSTSSGPGERSQSVTSRHSVGATATAQPRSGSVASHRAGSEPAGEPIIKRRPLSGATTPKRSTTPAGAAAADRAAAHESVNAHHAAAAAHEDAALAHEEAAVAHEAAAARAEEEAAEAVAAAAAEAEAAAAAAAVAEAEAAAEAERNKGPDYAALIEELRREREQLAEDEATLGQRLQLYSEVVGLRKELAVVQEDEERLRQQLASTEAVIAASDPEVAKEVAIFEDEAQQSTLQKIWAEEAEYHNPDNMEWAEIDVNNLRERVDAAHAKFAAASEKADALYAQQEEAINETTDAREREKAAIAENHEREMENLDEARAHARQVASEQHYHRHRGTANRAQPVVSKEKERTTRQRRVDEVEFKTTAQVAKMKDDLAELMEEVKILKRQLDDSRETTEKKRREQEAALKVVEDEGADAREFKERLTKEEAELKELKADLQGVLHYVRAKNREEEGW